MGGAGGGGKAPPEGVVVNGIGAAYDRAGKAWHTGPEHAYERLAAALLDHAPCSLAGARVLDVGAGTGVAGQVALRRGAGRAVASDLAAGMLRQRAPGIAAVVADAQVLPFTDDSFDLVVAAFSLGHLPDPSRALLEARRVAPSLVASAFAPSWAHPAKPAVDGAMAAYGFTPPDWYADMKAHESRVEDPDALACLAEGAGYPSVRVVEVDVRTGITTAAQMVDWRWGMAHLAPFLAALPPADRARARADAEAAVTGMDPVVVPMLALSASRSPTTS